MLSLDQIRAATHQMIGIVAPHRPVVERALTSLFPADSDVVNYTPGVLSSLITLLEHDLSDIEVCENACEKERETLKRAESRQHGTPDIEACNAKADVDDEVHALRLVLMRIRDFMVTALGQVSVRGFGFTHPIPNRPLALRPFAETVRDRLRNASPAVRQPISFITIDLHAAADLIQQHLDALSRAMAPPSSDRLHQLELDRRKLRRRWRHHYEAIVKMFDTILRLAELDDSANRLYRIRKRPEPNWSHASAAASATDTGTGEWDVYFQE